jgi:Phage integrase, N-terminal SAM-like domain
VARTRDAVRARGLSLADYAEQWLEVMRCRLRPTTSAGYEVCLRRAVRRLRSVPISRLTPQLIQACYAGPSVSATTGTCKLGSRTEPIYIGPTYPPRPDREALGP